MSQLLEKVKQGEHVFDVNAEPEPEAEEEDCQDFGQDFDAEYEDGPGEGGEELKEGSEAQRKGR